MSRTTLPLLLTASRLVLGPLYVLAVGALGASGFAGPGTELAGAAAAPGPGGGAASGGALPALPLIIAGVASLTDFVDGRLARRLAVTSPRGAALDVAADAAFLLCALGALAAVGALSWVLPLAALGSLGALALRWRSAPPADAAADGGPLRPRRRPPDAVGHLAGILNYGAVLVASGVPLGAVSASWLPAASVAVAAVNLAPIALRRIAG